MNRWVLIFWFIFVCRWGSGAEPLDQTRVLKYFDFEERQRGNVEDLPMDWVKIEGPGLPHYVNGRLTTDQARSGRYSFRFDLNGGSLLYRYPAGKIKVYPHANYKISVWVKTDPLPNARARLTAYLTDQDHRTIPASVTHSEPFVSTDREWSRLEIQLEAPEQAVWMVLELGLLQPALYQPTTLGRAALFEQDIRGTVWFDDLTVAQVPRANLFCDRPGNIFRRSDPIALRVRISDRFTDDLACQLKLTDASGQTVYQYTGAILLSSEPSETPEHAPKIGSIVLPDLQAGWYRASLQLISRGVVVADESMDLLRLADEGEPIEPDARFGVIATDLPQNAWNELPQILPYLGVGRIKLSVWNAEEDIESHQLPFALLLESFRNLGITPTACLAAPPPKVSKLIGGDRWSQILKASPESWQASLSYLVSRYSGYLDRWQLGLDEQALDFVNDASMRRAYQAVFEQFNHLVDQPDLAMPWSALFETQGPLPPSVSLSIPSEILPEQIPLYLHDIRGSGPSKTETTKVSLGLQSLPEDRYDRKTRLRDTVQRVVYALAGGADRIDLPLPLSVRGNTDSQVKQPEELFLILRTLLQNLSKTTYKGQVPLGESVEAFLFDRNGQGILVLWSKSGSGQTPYPVIQLVLGKHPQRIDLWGNLSPVLQPKNENGVIELEVGPIPTILIGIDGYLAQLRGSFAFDNPLIESSFKPHVRRLRFTNPYPVPINGRLRLQGPQGWTVVAQQPSFSLAPNETYDAPVTIEFPYSSFAGTKTIDCDVELQGAETRQFKVPVLLKLGLGDIGLSTIALRDRNDIIVQQVITNYSNRPVNYTAYVSVPGSARQERLVTDLNPGKTVIKKYRFNQVRFPDNQAPKVVRSGVKETEGTRVLNEEVQIQ